MIDVGTGPLVVMIPGVQGRWEWMAAAVEAVSRRCRVISFSLAGERGSARPEPRVFEDFVKQLDEVLERAGAERAVVCGVSYGGLIAARYAADRPTRTSGLILVSAPSPRLRLDARTRRYVSHPRLWGLLFFVEAFRRFANELMRTYATWPERITFAVRHASILVRAPMSPTRSGRRVLMTEGLDLASDCRRISVPALIVSGDPRIAPQIVPPQDSLEYLDLLPRATAVMLERTGHLGLVTRPDRFAAVVSEFAAACTTTRTAGGSEQSGTSGGSAATSPRAGPLADAGRR